MKVFIGIFVLVGLLGCGGIRQSPDILDTDKEFEVPSGLADQFTVREAGSAPVKPAEGAAVSADAKAPVDPKTGKAPKLSKKAQKAAEKKKKKDAASEAKWEIKNRWTMPPIFQTGEHSVFDITYFGATAGQLVLETLPPKMVAGRSTFHFRATAASTSVFSLFYRLNDVAETFVDTEGLFSHKYSVKIDESRQTRDVLELYDQSKRKAYYWSKWKKQDHDLQKDESVIDLAPYTQDGLSAFYYVRTLPLDPGGVYEFQVANNGKLRTVRITVVRREKLNTKIGEIPAIVIKPEVVLDGVLSSYGDSFMWISDDARRIMLKIDAKIKVGSVVGYLREHNYGEANSAASSK